MQFNLNEKQQEAVKHRGSPLLIIAGAGTGKTAVITQRILDIIESGDAKPSEILALTFTEKAAAEMIERVDMAMPIGYEEVSISTFHSFCDDILRQDGVYMGLDTDYTLMSQAQSYIFFRKNLYDLPLDTLRPLGNPTQNIGHILRHFSRLQDEDVFPEEYLDYVDTLPRISIEDEQQFQTDKELAETYKMYVDLKIKNSKIDFGDLIMQALKLLREKRNILKRYHNQYKYILVDEFQDTNYTQSALINLIAIGAEPSEVSKANRKGINITVVGDDDQAIYKFRGAAISNIMHFKKNYTGVKKIVLNENYRSKQEILDASYQLIQHNNPNRLEITENVDKKLQSRGEFYRNGGNPIKMFVADTATEEADMVAKEILKLTGNSHLLQDENSIVNKQYDDLGQGMFVDVDKGDGDHYKFSDIAILARAHAHADDFVQALKYYGIPYKYGGPKGLYTRPEVSILISYLRILVDYTDEISMFNILRMDSWGLSSREIVEIIRFGKKKKKSSFEVIEEMWGVRIADTEEYDLNNPEYTNLALQVLSEQSRVGITSFLKLFEQSISQLKLGWSVGEVLYDFFKESGLLESLLAEGDAESDFKVQNITKYFEMLKAFESANPGITAREYVDYLDFSIEIGETPNTDADNLEDYNAVNIHSVHGSKGLEYPAVFLINLVSDRFPTRNRKDHLPIPNDLIKDYLVDVDDKTEHLMEERRLFYVGATRAKEKLYLTAAKFYGDAKRKKKPSIFLDEIMDKKVVEDFESSSTGGQKKPNFAVHISTETDSIDVEDLRGLDPSYISYSHINTYLTCPKKYKYQYILGIPGPESSVLAFGRSVHNSLRYFYTDLQNFQSGLEGVTKAPDENDLLAYYEDKWLSEGYDGSRHEKIRKDYGREIMKKYFKDVFSIDEKPIGLEVQFKYKMDDIIIRGSIDRIDLLEDGDQQVVELIDYKTGRLKDSKEVDKDLQLAIYALVAEESLGFKVQKASLIFVEHGVKISVEIDDAKRDAVRQEVKEVITRIRNKEFAPKPGFLCGFCDYKEICEDAMVTK